MDTNSGLRMEDIKLSLSQSGPSGEISIIRVDGVVDTITASELENIIENLLSQNRHKILVDLGGVEYISSAGWGIFVSKIHEIREHDGDIKLVNMIPNVYEIYELLEFENIIQAYDNLEVGRQAFNLPGSESNAERVGDAEEGDVDKKDESVWKANTEAVAGASFQTAMSPGLKDRARQNTTSSRIRPSGDSPAEIILTLIIDDPFSSISELAELGSEIAPKFSFGWWKVFGILKRSKLLRRRSRFRYARRQNRHL